MSCQQSGCNGLEACGCQGFVPQVSPNGLDCGPQPTDWRPANPFEANPFAPQVTPARKSSYPVDAVAAQGTQRVEPLLTPKQLQDRFLKGIPLVSAVMDPITKRHSVWTTDDLRDTIVRAVNEVELMTGTYVFPVRFSEGHPLDRSLLNSFMRFKVNNQPILSVESIAIPPGVGGILYEIPAAWVSTSHYNSGIVNLLPLVFGDTDTNGNSTATGGGAVFLSIIAGGSPFLPLFWTVTYSAGYPNGCLPVVLNELIGVFAAIEVLGQLGATNRASSTSLGIDSLSQSISTGGTSVYANRIKDLEAKKATLMSKFKALSGKKFAMGTV